MVMLWRWIRARQTLSRISPWLSVTWVGMGSGSGGALGMFLTFESIDSRPLGTSLWWSLLPLCCLGAYWWYYCVWRWSNPAGLSTDWSTELLVGARLLKPVRLWSISFLSTFNLNSKVCLKLSISWLVGCSTAAAVWAKFNFFVAFISGEVLSNSFIFSWYFCFRVAPPLSCFC